MNDVDFIAEIHKNGNSYMITIPSIIIKSLKAKKGDIIKINIKKEMDKNV